MSFILLLILNILKLEMAKLLSHFKAFLCRSTMRSFSIGNVLQDSAGSGGDSYRFVVAGGGAGGLAVASYLARKYPNQVAVVDPADVSIINNSYFFSNQPGKIKPRW